MSRFREPSQKACQTSQQLVMRSIVQIEKTVESHNRITKTSQKESLRIAKVSKFYSTLMVQMKYEIFLRVFNDIFCGIRHIFEDTYSDYQ